MRTLVLNSGYEPMQLISWQRALCLVLSSKAEIVAQYGEVVRSVRASFPLPSVVRLVRYVRFIKRYGIVKCNRRNVFLRDRYQCQYCGVRCNQMTVTLDHIIPRSRGGQASWENLVTSCSICNRKKGDRTLDDCGMRLRSVPRRPSWSDLIEYSNMDVESAWLPYLAVAG